MRAVNLHIISELKSFLTRACAEKAKYCQAPTDFTRTRKLPFNRVVLLIINMLKRSLSVELVDFFEHIDALAQSATKSAFSIARKKLKPSFFEDWNEVLFQTYYQKANETMCKWKNFILKSTDGSTAYLFNDKDKKMEEHFGLHNGKVMARLMVCYDVLNELVVLGKIDKIKTSENAIVYDWLDALQSQSAQQGDCLLLYDAKFAGFRMIYEHLKRKLDFVIRCSPEFSIQIKRFVESGKKQQIIDMHPNTPAVKEMQQLGYSVNIDTRLRVRLVRVELDNGEIEVLITSLLDRQKYPHADFKPLYKLRWGSETHYDTLKNKLQIEAVSGHSPEAVLQDFHAAIMVSNLQSIVEQECTEELTRINERRELDYAVNQNVAIGCMKHRVVQLFLAEQPQQILNQLKGLFLKHLEPIRPDRSFPRIKKIQHLNGKYKTLKNYRRAI